MSSAHAQRQKSAAIKGRLRGKFMARDRLVAELAALDTEISGLIRTLSSEDGLVTPMRPERARQVVFDEMDRAA